MPHLSFNMPKNACNSHLHIIDPAFPNDGKAEAQRGTVEEYKEVAAKLHLPRAVFVQAKPFGTDNTCLLDAIEKFGPKNAVGIAVVNNTVSDAELERLNAGGVKGLRFSVWNPKNAVVSFDDCLPLSERCADMGWNMQLHMGALRNNNRSMYEKLGADIGFDSINDYNIAEGLSKLLNSMNESGELPKTILYTLNPKDNYVLATMLGNFQSSECAGKIQFGSGWWFNDQRDGMTEQMKALGNLGALCKFVGMLTDSRSFLSYTRHEYFRRIMCNILGGWVENGEFPQDYGTLGKIVEDISYKNAKNYFGF